MTDFRSCHKQKAWGAFQNKGNHDLIWNQKLEDKRQAEWDGGRERERGKKNVVCQMPTDDAPGIWQMERWISPESNVLKLKNLPVHCLG